MKVTCLLVKLIKKNLVLVYPFSTPVLREEIQCAHAAIGFRNLPNILPLTVSRNV
jgi:hypothetical protein